MFNWVFVGCWGHQKVTKRPKKGPKSKQIIIAFFLGHPVSWCQAIQCQIVWCQIVPEPNCPVPSCLAPNCPTTE